MAVSFDRSFGVQYANNGYQFIDDEADGDTSVLTENELNAALAKNNATFRLHDGIPVGLDGQPIDLPASTITTFDSTRPLPPVGGPTASTQQVRDRVSYFDLDGSTDAALMWATVMTLARSAMQDMKDAREMKAIAQEQKIAAKSTEIAAMKEKIEAEKDAAQQAFITGLCAAAVTAVLGYAGAAGAGGASTAGALSASAGVAGQLITQASSYQSVAWGPKARANEAELKAKRWAMTAEMLDQSIEDKKANYDASKEQFKAALKLIDDHYEQQTQVVSKIFQG